MTMNKGVVEAEKPMSCSWCGERIYENETLHYDEDMQKVCDYCYQDAVMEARIEARCK